MENLLLTIIIWTIAFEFSLLMGMLTIFLIKFFQQHHIKKKYGYKENINIVNMGGNDEILMKGRKEQSAQDFH